MNHIGYRAALPGKPLAPDDLAEAGQDLRHLLRCQAADPLADALDSQGPDLAHLHPRAFGKPGINQLVEIFACLGGDPLAI